MKKLILLLTFMTLLLLNLKSQDRNIGNQLDAPEGLLYENGGRFIDVTAPPFNAKGDGVTDDTDAFIAAYTFFVKEIIKNVYADKDPDRSYIIYIPDGNYLVSNTIIYEWTEGNGYIEGHHFTSEGITQLRFIGQSRENTIIQLSDNAAGFEAGANKPVLTLGKIDFNNTAASNNVRNLTINTGSGNPGAIGLIMGGANSASGSNLLIKSDDGQGAIGLDFNIGTVIGWYHDITVDGFDVGIRYKTDNHFVHPIIEHTTLMNQKLYGMKFEGVAAATLRKVYSNNSVPVIYGNNIGVFPTIVDCEFTGGGAGNAAILLDEGQSFVRDVKIGGYGSSITYKSASEVIGDIDEWVSTAPTKFDATMPDKSMDLPIEDVPIYWNNDTTQWADVHDYGAVGDGTTDDADAIQKALNSGKPVVYFTKSKYYIGRELYVPSTVKLIAGFYTTLLGHADDVFVIDEYSNDPVVFADFRINEGSNYNHASGRTIVLDNSTSQWNLYKNTSPVKGAKVFINSCTGLRSQGPLENVKAWIRFVNTESNASQFIVKNSQVVVLCYKTEKNETSFEAHEGSRLEILAGISNQQAWNPDNDNPAIINDNSHLSATFYTSKGYTQGFDTILFDQQDGITKVFAKEDFPVRSTSSDYVNAVPLYLSYEPAALNVTGVNIQVDTISMPLNDSLSVNAEIIPFMAENDTLTWTSLNESVATVSQDGVVKSLTIGVADIVVETKEGGFKDTTYINVIEKPTIEILNCPSDSLRNDLLIDLDVSLSPSNYFDDFLNWWVSDEQLATVNSKGEVLLKKSGTVKVFVSDANGLSTDSCEIKIYNYTRHGEYLPKDDAYIRGGSNAQNNYGLEPELIIKKGNVEAYFRKSLVKFAIPPVDSAISNAIIRFYCEQAVPATLTFFKTGDDWNENEVTWENAPVEEDVISTMEITTDGFYEVDVTEYVQQERYKDSTVSFIIDDLTASNEQIKFFSKQSYINPPILKVEYEPTVNVESVSITNCPDVPVYVGDVINLEHVLVPENSTNTIVEWSTLNPDVVSVTDGQVTALAEGTATIQVHTIDGNHSATCVVEVKKLETNISLTFTDKIKVYPNPVKDIVYISYNGKPIHSANIELISPTGAIIKQLNLSKNVAIDMTGLANGLYIIRVMKDDNIAYFNVIKN